MFLSDTLNAIYEESGKFDLDTCNKIILTIGDRAREDIGSYADVAKQKNGINSKVLLSCLDNIDNVFKRFTKEHDDIPSALVRVVNENMQGYRQLIYDAVQRTHKQ